MTPRLQNDRRPRVLQCITRLGLGGAEAVALSIAEGMRAEFDFGVFAVRGVERGEIGRAMQSRLAALDIPVFAGPRLPLKLGGMVAAGIRENRVLRRFSPDIAHLHTEIPESAHASMLALRGSRPAPAVVRTIHNSVYWHFWPRLGRWCERRLRRAHIACVSQDAAEAFTKHRESARAGPPPAAPVVIYNGLVPAAERAVAARHDGPFRVLFAGRFEPEKGTDLLPEIVRSVRPPAAGAELDVYGQGGHRGLLDALAERPPAGWSIRLHPPVAELRSRMRDFDVVIMPSRFEGLGLVAIEAQLEGLIVVATDAKGLREAIPPDHAWRAEPGNASSFAAVLQAALDNCDAWPAAIAIGRRFARQRFDFGTMLAQYAELYRRALVPAN